MIPGIVAGQMREASTPGLPTVIGEPFGGGFYAGDIQYPDGQWYKLIVADASADILGLQWEEGGTLIGASSLIDGVFNTNAMVSASLGRFPAGALCVNHVGGGNSDWYMAARAELNTVYTNLNSRKAGGPADFLLGGPQAFSDAQYYSSSEVAANSVWIQTFSNGIVSTNYKFQTSRRVRPIRRIPFTP